MTRRGAVLATAGLLASFPAVAQTVRAPGKDVRAGVTECIAKHGGYTNAAVDCAGKALDGSIKNNIQRSKDAKLEGASAAAHAACTKSLMEWAQSDTARQPIRIKIVNGIRGDKPFTEIDTCKLLKEAQRLEAS